MYPFCNLSSSLCVQQRQQQRSTQILDKLMMLSSIKTEPVPPPLMPVAAASPAAGLYHPVAVAVAGRRDGVSTSVPAAAVAIANIGALLDSTSDVESKRRIVGEMIERLQTMKYQLGRLDDIDQVNVRSPYIA